jgi:hypothetical protein
MPDWNNDREGHAEHKFIVQNASQLERHKFPPGSPNIKFDRWGRAVVMDEGLAREIQRENPKEIAVTRMRMPGHADRGHRYFFGQLPAMPWKKEEGDGESD